MIKEGDEFPAFELMGDDDKIHTEKEIKEGLAVIYFYPKDMTSGCTREACAFRDNIQKFNEINAKVFGVSVDSIESHKKFKENIL
jgi:peroxiredoxin Q/BCP